MSLGYDASSHDDLSVLSRELCPLTHPSTGPLLLRRREWPRGAETEGGALWQLNDHFGDEAVRHKHLNMWSLSEAFPCHTGLDTVRLTNLVHHVLCPAGVGLELLLQRRLLHPTRDG